MNEITLNSKDVTYDVPKVTFPSYGKYLARANDIAAQITAMEVSADNIQEAKGLLADARKVTDGLNRIRIDIKKEILSDYTTFESQVKDLCKVIDEADAQLRSKVRILDNKEREEKKAAIREIWDKRIQNYSFQQFYPDDPFYRFLTRQHLNKSTSMKSVEKDMTYWMQEHEKNVATANSMGVEYLAEYVQTDDLALAIENVKELQELTDLITEVDTDEEEEEKAVFIVKGTKDISFAETLLKTNNINYERK